MKQAKLSSIKHIFKLDPDKELTNEQIKELCQSGTDAIMVGGTLGITYEETEALLKEIRKYKILVIQEISNLEAIVPGFDYYYIPLVLNAQNPDWILNVHQKALIKYGEWIDWQQVLVEGYVVLNENSSVAKLTASKTMLTPEDVIAYARIGVEMLKLPILYIEYSGIYGDPALLEEIREALPDSHIFYGGGINSKERAEEMSKWANTIVVGNLIYENFHLALQTIH